MAVRTTSRTNAALTRILRSAIIIGALTAGAFASTTAGASAQPLAAPSQSTHVQQVAFYSSAGSQAVSAAESKVGAPYVWGATGPSSFDCSGLVQWAYAQAGVSIPRTTYAQEAGGVPVSRGDLQPGDLVLYYGGDHVGIYAGNGTVVHAPTSGQSVTYAPVDSMPFHAARRY
ncbi:glycoside hydrolase [Rhodococcus sp. ACPA4]|jgi:cell wall-associated NlpC family hydrolase|uniref:Cell wall-associated NlpC family hydrolase n=1 Tax=Nocardia globerula TaxID=1818 RepID=A0A652YZC1_NOCGL|nr:MULTISPECIES: C40 family peptidase [Rhodococcus]NMD58687.1 C40 family peptidase [Nocardia globerula]MCE4263863.1 C40 family peptidase [Rhodococcus globerulus]MDV8066732.1 C40 family peptidase [Rhodococcus sp. IEGM 1366]NRI66367.1 NlpC/P60 family protein [Rhodococcus sp. MS16]PBC41373.1 glycoside hydrolase [Rhodococcus sp. ACPA4]